MKLPVIKSLASDRKLSIHDISTAINILEIIGMSRGISKQELNVIGELLSNLEGAKIVIEEHRHHEVPLKEALNKFMRRVVSSIK